MWFLYPKTLIGFRFIQRKNQNASYNLKALPDLGPIVSLRLFPSIYSVLCSLYLSLMVPFQFL